METIITPSTQDVSVLAMKFTTGTWTYSDNSGNPKYSKSANAETTTISIPLTPRLSSNNIGLYLTSIDIPITIGVANLTSYTFTLYKSDLSSTKNDGSVAVPAATTITQTDNGAVTFHANPTKFTISVTTPAFDGSASTNITTPHNYLLVASLVCPASTTLDVYAASWKFNEIR